MLTNKISFFICYGKWQVHHHLTCQIEDNGVADCHLMCHVDKLTIMNEQHEKQILVSSTKF